LDENGLKDDSQADICVQGYLEKAIHHYAAENMDYRRIPFPNYANNFFQAALAKTSRQLD